jgi:hypothetical protein
MVPLTWLLAAGRSPLGMTTLGLMRGLVWSLRKEAFRTGYRLLTAEALYLAWIYYPETGMGEEVKPLRSLV